jgi:hypothetical protein
MIGSDHLLIHKLDAFVRKYYKNQLLKGSIIFLGVFVLAFLGVALLEYFGRYTSAVRAVLFFFLLILSLGLLVRYILYPLSKLAKLGAQLSREQAAEIIGKHFAQVNDKLLNALQLMGKANQDESLLLAAIEQKTSELSPVPFSAAIDYKRNMKYARLALIPVLALLAILLVAPSLVSDGAQRVIQYNKTFKVPAPFDFIVENKTLTAEQYQDYELKVRMEGSELPNEVFVHTQNQVYRMEKTDASHFVFQFRNVQQHIPFYLEALGFEDDQKVLQVWSKPVILGYSVNLDYPSYLQMKDEVIANPADLSIPAGTIVKWQFTGKQTNEISLKFNELKAKANSTDGVHYTYSRKFFLSDSYSIKLSNEQVKKGDSLHFQIEVIPDAFPSIEVEEQRDSVSGKIYYFGGIGSDDHGLSKLTFNYRFVASEDKAKMD